MSMDLLVKLVTMVMWKHVVRVAVLRIVPDRTTSVVMELLSVTRAVMTVDSKVV